MRPAIVLATVLSVLSAFAGPAAAAEPPSPLKPLAFLAGHCWKGALAQGSVDEHCFEWLADGHALRDRHVVRTAGRTDATGETIYFVDSSTQRVEYLYVESSGGFSRGSVEAQPDALVFPDGRYVEDGETLVYRARWTLAGPDGYEAWSEAQTPAGWKTMFKMQMKRSD